MNRVFKFRAWSHTDKNWLQPSTIEVWDDTGILKAFYGGDYIIEQWTGLQDASGRDIYEGDIVLASEARYVETLIDRIEGIPVYEVDQTKPLPAPDIPIFTAVIEWNDYLTGFQLAYLTKPAEWNEGLLASRLIDKEYRYEIVGNIHENPPAP